MPGRMFGAPVARIVEQRRGWCRPAIRTVVADVSPQPSGVRLALGQYRHRRVVAMQASGPKHMVCDKAMQRRQGRGTGTDLVGQRRQADVHALAGIALGLPVEWLVLSELLEQHLREELRSEQAARRDVERRGRLGHRLAGTAGEALAHRLHHLPAARHDLEGFCHILTQLRQPVGPAARAMGRRCHDDALARQMGGQRLA